MITLRLKRGAKSSCPWITARDIADSSSLLLAEAGELCAVENARGECLGIGYYNRASAIACRLLTARREAIDAAWFHARLERALARRSGLPAPYYRLVHSEGDFLPGLVIDRFDDAYVLQVSTAGMERLLPLALEALDGLLAPSAVLLRNDISARTREGLPQEVRVLRGGIPALTEIQENGVIYLADLLHGQKTGWFFDQRDNRALIAAQAAGRNMLDVFSHSGGFGLAAAKAGAKVTLVDSSALALELAVQAAALSRVEVETRRGDAFAVMGKLAEEAKRYGIVVADPPAFVKARADIASGLKGYAKVARYASALVEPGGLLMVCSCSHHALRPRFREAVLEGVMQARRKAEVLAFTGHAPDHPVHPELPQGEYLKALLLKLD